MKEDLGLWAEDQEKLRELALEALVSGRTTFISPFTGTRKSVLDLLDLRNLEDPYDKEVRPAFLPYNTLDFIHAPTREELFKDLTNPDLDFTEGGAPRYFALLKGGRLELFRLGNLGSPERVFKRKIKRK